MRALPDVNTLIALADTDHKFHRTAKAWMTQHGDFGWASCPLTQNGCLRIMSQPSYPGTVALTTLLPLLQRMCAASAHRFFADDFSVLDTAVFNLPHIHSPKQLTDLYLLALAVKQDARLVTFDQRIPLSAVHGAKPQHLVVI